MVEENEKGLTKAIAVAVAIVIISVISALVIGSITSSNLFDCTNTTTNDSSIVLTELTDTLSPIGEGIVSYDVKSNNDTWLNFDGVDDKVDFGKSFDGIRGISTWIKANSSAINQKFITNGNGSSEKWTFMLEEDDLILANTTNTRIQVTTANISDNEWHHLYGDLENMKIYIDGVDTTIEVHPVGTSVIGNAKLGCRDTNQHCFDGSLDKVKLFNNTISPAQILALYTNGRLDVNNSDTLMSLNLNENTGSITYDLSGYSNNGNINGSTWDNDGVLNNLTEVTDYTINTVTGLFTIVDNDYSWAGLITNWNYVSGESCPSGVNPNDIAEDFGAFIDGLLGFLGIIGIVLGVIWLIMYVAKLFSKGGLNDLGQTA